MDTPVYLDNNATTRLAPEALEAMLPYLREQYGNAGSAHLLGRLAEGAVAHARGQVAALLGCGEAEVVFNSGGTEGLNHAIRGVFEAKPGRRHFVTTAVEHSAVLAIAQWLQAQGVEVTLLGVDRDGRLDLGRLEAALRPDTALVSVMAANNESGVLFPLEEAGRIARARGVLFHVDGTQAVGKVPIDLSRLPVDLLNLSAHKLHGPKGVGVLYLRRGLRVRPFMVGGGQERGRRGGTENVPGIVGLGKAAELAAAHLEAMAGPVRALRDRLEADLLDRVPDIRINGAGAGRVPNTSFVSFRGIEGEALFLKLSDRGVCVSTGKREPSHVLRAMGLEPEWAQGTVRFSLSRYTTGDEIRKVADLVLELVAELRASGAVGRR
jgi:cysteine desulfurase